jgi:dihydropyrimidinase
MLDTIIKNGNVYLAGNGIQQVDIGVKDGKIVALMSSSDAAEAKRVFDAVGKFIMPGAIDPHVHFGIYNGWNDDFESESKFAALGGVTTVITYYREMGSYFKVFEDLVAGAESKSLIDFGIHLGLLTNQHVAELDDYVEKYGVRSYKFYTNYMGRVAQIFKTEDALMLDDGDLDHILNELSTKEKDIVLCVHCENMEVSRKQKIENAGNKADSLSYYESLSPDYAETESVLSTLYLAKKNNAHLYVVHLSAGSSVDCIEQMAHFLGEKITIETCPHYLTQTVDSDAKLQATVNPPIRTQTDSDKLWHGIEKGIITSLGSDNCSLMREAKAPDSINTVKPGFGGVGLNIPLMLTEGYHKRNIPLATLVKVLSETPAKTFGLFPQKGIIGVGADADLVVIDLESEKTVSADTLCSSSDFSIYQGRKLKGWPVMTFSRGDLIMHDGKIVGKSGRGRYLQKK